MVGTKSTSHGDLARSEEGVNFVRAEHGLTTSEGSEKNPEAQQFLPEPTFLHNGAKPNGSESVAEDVSGKSSNNTFLQRSLLSIRTINTKTASSSGSGNTSPSLKRSRDSKFCCRRPTKQCFTKKCCCISSLVACLVMACMFLVSYLIFRKVMADAMVGGASTKDQQLWAKVLSNGTEDANSSAEKKIKIAGKYLLVSYDEGYEKYLSSFGMPSFIVSMMKGAKETMVFTVPETIGGYYTSTTINAFMEQTNRFKLGEVFTTPWGQRPFFHGTLHSNCTRPEENVLEYISEDRDRGWLIKLQFIFSHKGIVNNRDFTTTGAKTTLYYKRLDDETEEVEKSDQDDDDDDDDDDNFFDDDDWEFGEDMSYWASG